MPAEHCNRRAIVKAVGAHESAGHIFVAISIEQRVIGAGLECQGDIEII